MNDEEVAALLERAKTIAVVGLSDKPWRASHGVARYMQGAGYRIFPVNPEVGSVLGERSYPSLEALPGPVDIINVFRRSEFIAELADQALRLPAKLFWTQLGVRDDAAAARLRSGGLAVVQDRCLMVEHRRLLA